MPMSTFLKSLEASWVRNGKPSIITDGLTGNPFDWNWLANWFSVTARATRSPITRRIRITMTANKTHDRAPDAALGPTLPGPASLGRRLYRRLSRRPRPLTLLALRGLLEPDGHAP